MNHAAVAALFNRTFAAHGVRMAGGAAEPLYEPGPPPVVHYTLDYAPSALHEAAHWCIAGRDRRRLVDYGYRYEPPPRDPAARRVFEAGEITAQAVEAAFCFAAGMPFRASADDLDLSEPARRGFERRVLARCHVLLRDGLPPRAERFRCALATACLLGDARCDA